MSARSNVSREVRHHLRITYIGESECYVTRCVLCGDYPTESDGYPGDAYKSWSVLSSDREQIALICPRCAAAYRVGKPEAA